VNKEQGSNVSKYRGKQGVRFRSIKIDRRTRSRVQEYQGR